MSVLTDIDDTDRLLDATRRSHQGDEKWCTFGDGMMAKRETGAQTNTDAPVRMSGSLDANDYADLKVIAEKKRVSLAWVVRDAVSDYFDARNPLFPRKRRNTGS